MTDNQRLRPESQAAQSFADSLDSVFGINRGPAADTNPTNTINEDISRNNDNLDGLSENVEAKKRIVTSQSEELAAIESRLKEAEERLARASKSQGSSRANSQARNLTSAASTSAAGRSQDYKTQAYGGAETVPRSSSGIDQPSSSTYRGEEYAQAQHPHAGVRPSNPQREDSLGLPPIPGAMPRTPIDQGYGSDYIAVEQRR